MKSRTIVQFIVLLISYVYIYSVSASNLTLLSSSNYSSTAASQGYPNVSHGAITLAGDDDYCGADNVIGRRTVTDVTTGAITAFEQYQRFINDTEFSGMHPYGTSSTVVNWSGNGTTTNNIGYQGPLTGGVTNAVPEAFGVYSWASGCGAYTTGNYSTAFGSNATATGAAAQAFGVSALASGTTSLAIGVGAEAAGDSSISLGSVSNAGGDNSVAIGMGASSSNDGDVALGSEAKTAAVTATTSGIINNKEYTYAGTSPVAALSIGDTGKERQLQNVAAGRISGISTDAVNGSQLFATNSALTQSGNNINNIADSLGGGAAIATDGSFTAPTYQIQGSGRSTVGDALTALDTSVTANTGNITTLQNDVNNISSGSVGLVRQDPTSRVVSVAAASGGTSVDLTGTDGVRTLTGVRDGTLAADSSEAVTGSQLYQTNTVLSSVATALGGGASFDNISQFRNPVYIIQGQSKYNVGDAFIAVDNTLTENISKINSLQAGQSGLVQQNANNKVISVASGSGGALVDFRGTDGERVLTGIADGAVSATSTDAVNGKQLYETNQKVAQNTTEINKLSSGIKDIEDGKVGLVQQSSNLSEVTIAKNSGGEKITVSGTDGNRQITGVKEGVNDNDVVTVSQLKEVSGSIGDASMLAVNSEKTMKPKATGKNAIALGGNARAEKDNAVAVGADANVTGENSIGIGNKSTVSSKNSVALGSNSVASEDNTVSVGSSLNQRRITNVAPGVNRSDAVTVGQLNESFSSLKQYTDRKVDSLDKKMGDMKTKLTAGIATSMALSGIPQAYQPDSSLVGVSAGTYGGESAIAVGVSHISQNGHWITKLHAGGNTQNDFGASVGVGYQW
ncbi:TPA: YadA family autotransporter adhesin [Escherichia coli]